MDNEGVPGIGRQGKSSVLSLRGEKRRVPGGRAGGTPEEDLWGDGWGDLWMRVTGLRSSEFGVRDESKGKRQMAYGKRGKMFMVQSSRFMG